MSFSPRVSTDFKNAQHEFRTVFHGAVQNKRPPLGFLLGFAATLIVIAAAAVLAGRYWL